MVMAVKTSPGFPVKFGGTIETTAIKWTKDVSGSIFADRIGI
jgi:hypothetical protein